MNTTSKERYETNIKRLQVMMEFQELRGGKDMEYWLQFQDKFG